MQHDAALQISPLNIPALPRKPKFRAQSLTSKHSSFVNLPIKQIIDRARKDSLDAAMIELK